MHSLLQSIGGVSTWLYHEPHQTLFDCGEGITSHLLSKIFAPNRLFLTHGHSDHLTGLPQMINARASMKGPNERGLDIFYPEGSWGCHDYLAFVFGTKENPRRLPFKCTFHAWNVGDKVTLANGMEMVAFATKHGNIPSLGYKIVDTVKKLSPAAYQAAAKQGLPIEKFMQQLPREARAQYNQKATRVTFAYTGDSMPVNPADVQGADILFHDATFLCEGDRDTAEDTPENSAHARTQTHATLPEAMEVAKQAGVKHLVAMHVSSRYLQEDMAAQTKQAKQAVRTWLQDNGYPFRFDLHLPYPNPNEYPGGRQREPEYSVPFSVEKETNI